METQIGNKKYCFNILESAFGQMYIMALCHQEIVQKYIQNYL